MTTISIVTGGSRGLGRNTAISIARHGGDVILTYRGGAEGAKAVVAEIESMGRRAVALQLDVGNTSAIPAFVEGVRSALGSTWDRESFDHLVNNAGHGEMAAFAETTEAQFDLLFDVHVKGVFFLTQALLPLLADGGRIVNFSSGLTRISYPGFSAYSAAKGAVEILTLYMAKELGSRGITANTIAPGAIETEFLGGAVRDTPEYNEAFAKMIALGRVGVTGPEVIETNKGVEEFDSKDKALVWSVVGGRNRRLIGGADAYATDTFAGFREAIAEVLGRIPAFALRTLRAENARLAARLERFAGCDGATDMWRALGVPEPAKLRDVDDDAFLKVAEQHGENRHDAR